MAPGTRYLEYLERTAPATTAELEEYASSILILVRSVFQVAEYLQGWDSLLLRSEVFIYVLNGLLLWFVMAIFLVIHLSEINCLLGRGKLMTAKGSPDL
jgi:hypothetical protein